MKARIWGARARSGSGCFARGVSSPGARAPDSIRSAAPWTGKPKGCWTSCPTSAPREARRELLDELHADGVPRGGAQAGRRRSSGWRSCRSSGCWARESALHAAGDRRAARASTSSTCRRRRRALGLPVPPIRTTTVLGERDLEAAGIGAKVREAGFDDEEMLETTRVLGRGMARYAEAMRTLGRRVAARSAARTSTSSACGSRPRPRSSCRSTAPWLDYVFTLHLRQVLRNDAVTFEEMTTGPLGEVRTDRRSPSPTSSASPSWARPSPVEELSGVAGSLSRLAGELVEPPVRLVKVIGDAVMLVSPEPEPMVATTLTLVERAEETDGLPQLRAGRGVRAGRQPLGRLVRLDGQPRQPADRPRAAGLRARHGGGPRRARGRRLRDVLGRARSA